MLRDDAIAEIQELLKFRTGLETPIIRRMERVKRLLEQGRTLPWFLITEDQTIPVTANNSGVNLPSNFIREYGKAPPGQRGIHYRESITNKPVFLRKMSLDEARALYYESTTSATYPVAYVVKLTEFELFPTPTVSFNLVMDYYEKDEGFQANNENLWLRYAPDLIIGNTAASMARTLNNKSAYDEASELAKIAWEALLKENIHREISNRRFILGRNA